MYSEGKTNYIIKRKNYDDVLLLLITLLENEKNMDGYDERYGWIHTCYHLAKLTSTLIYHPYTKIDDIKKIINSTSQLIENMNGVSKWSEYLKISDIYLSANERGEKEAISQLIKLLETEDITNPKYHFKRQVSEIVSLKLDSKYLKDYLENNSL